MNNMHTYYDVHNNWNGFIFKACNVHYINNTNPHDKIRTSKTSSIGTMPLPPHITLRKP